MTYTPDLSSGINESFFSNMETFAVRNNIPCQTKRRLTEIFIELFQNIQKHSVDSATAHLEINKSEKSYSIKSSNLVNTNDVRNLSHRIKSINKLSRDEVKKNHTITLSKTVLSKKFGAGLGFYRMAIRSAQKLNYEFHSIGNNLSLFTLQVNLNSEA